MIRATTTERLGFSDLAVVESPTRGRVYTLFMAGATLAELSRAFMVSEAEIETALRGHIARRERERKC